MATKPAPKKKSAERLLTEKLMRGGKSRQQYNTEQKMRANAAAKKKASEAAAKTTSDQRYRDAYKTQGHLPTIFANESKTRFLEADAVDVGQLGKDVVDGKITKEQALERIRQGAAVNDPDRIRVGLDVAAEIDPQVSAIERRRKLAKDTLDRTLAEDTTEATRTNVHIKGIYDALLNRLAGTSTAVAGNYDQTATAINDRYAQLQQQINQAYGNANAATAAEVAGAQGGTTQGQTLGAQDQGAYGAIAAIQNQGMQSQLAAGKMGELGVQRSTQNYAAYTGASEQASILKALQQRAADLRAEYGAEDYELGGQASDLESGRYGQLYEGYQSLQDNRAQALQDAEDRAYDRSMAERALGVKEYSAETTRYGIDAQTARENARLRQEAQIAANKHNIEARRLQLEITKENDPVRKMILQNQADAEGAKAAKYMAEAANVGKGAGGKDGKPDKYTQGMSVIQNIPGIRPDQVNYLQGVVDSAAARADYDKFFINKATEYMTNRLKQDGYQSDAVQRYTRQALAIILGVV